QRLDGVVRDGWKSERRYQRFAGIALQKAKDAFPPRRLRMLDDLKRQAPKAARDFDRPIAEGLVQIGFELLGFGGLFLGLVVKVETRGHRQKRRIETLVRRALILAKVDPERRPSAGIDWFF